MEATDAYDGSGDGWGEGWRNNLGLWKRHKPFPTTEMESASFEMKRAALKFMGARMLVAQAESAREFFPMVGVGAFDGLQSM